MKRYHVLLLLVPMMFCMFTAYAQVNLSDDWQADITSLMDAAEVPDTCEIRYTKTYDEGVSVDSHDIACEITVNGVVYGCEFCFEVTGEVVADWSVVQDWLGSIITGAATTAGSDADSLAQAIDTAIIEARSNDTTGAIWTQDRFAVTLIRVSTPFYPELKVGKNGDETKRLQQRLIELGFLNGSADGIFGDGTKSAVAELESYVRELEQDVIEANPTPTPTPAAVPTPAATPATIALNNDHELTLVPRETEIPKPTPIPESTQPPMDVAEDSPLRQPQTVVDGVAENTLQAYLYSDSFIIARVALTQGDTGEDVTRLQRKLKNLGYSSDTPDGNYGSGTARAVRVFQHYNNLTETGEADIETQTLLFSSAAQSPTYAILSVGSSGDDVKTLQTRLCELGFTNISADGHYGSGTKTAVETLQQYMISTGLDTTVEVNGIADPLLLDTFYSGSFPDIPTQMSTGDTGADVARVQRRLSGLEFYDGSADRNYGEKTAEAVSAFQKRHKLTRSGIADLQTLAMLFSANAQKALKPYLIKVSTDDQRVYVYTLDDDNEYTVLYKEMKCSTGRDATPTPKGTYTSTTGPGARWHYFTKFDCWAQYAYYIEGDIMFHSVLYAEKEGKVTQSSVNNLGKKASHGCVRLSVEDAKWIYENCPSKTTVIVY